MKIIYKIYLTSIDFAFKNIIYLDKYKIYYLNFFKLKILKNIQIHDCVQKEYLNKYKNALIRFQ